ncbi:MAG: HAD-IA family hydrolase [Dehalococcoidia bacterium]|nr:HAD-IA family hydrolase [Dehalococcoidia bacterium]
MRTAREKGCRIALATSSLTTEAQRVVQALDLTGDFDAIIGLDQVTHGKPDPEINLKAAAALGVAPAHCLVIEDSSPGWPLASPPGST